MEHQLSLILSAGEPVLLASAEKPVGQLLVMRPGSILIKFQKPETSLNVRAYPPTLTAPAA